MEVYLATVQSSGSEPSLISLIVDADFIVQMVLLVLIFMSVACWAIIIQKSWRLRAARTQSARFLDLFWNTKRLDEVYEQCGKYRKSPVAEVFKAGYQELAKIMSQKDADGRTADATDNLARTLRRAAAVESTNMEAWVNFLGTTGSTAPFIGLLGTVWGILLAFQKLGQAGQATIDVVGPDIAHALIATAVGLFAAIPAVVAYNSFNRSIRVLNTEMENFSSDFLNIVKRQVR